MTTRNAHDPDSSYDESTNPSNGWAAPMTVCRPQAISLTRLYRQLGFKHNHIPPQATGKWDSVECVDWMDRPVGRFHVILLASHSDRRRVFKHRLFVVCPRCRRPIPAGRWHQHQGTRTCALTSFSL